MQSFSKHSDLLYYDNHHHVMGTVGGHQRLGVGATNPSKRHMQRLGQNPSRQPRPRLHTEGRGTTHDCTLEVSVA